MIAVVDTGEYRLQSRRSRILVSNRLCCQGPQLRRGRQRGHPEWVWVGGGQRRMTTSNDRAKGGGWERTEEEDGRQRGERDFYRR